MSITSNEPAPAARRLTGTKDGSMKNRRQAARSRAATVIATLLAAFLVLAGCSSAEPAKNGAAGDSLLAQHDLDGLSAEQVIEKLDTMQVSDRPADLIASVQPQVLALSDKAGNQSELPMPDDKVYISVAPYQQKTHDCYYHSLTTCLGELGGADVQVTVTDKQSGAVLLDEARQLYDNGFVGLWVPRGIAATVTVEYDGTSGNADISTVNNDDPTCITTLQLT